MSVFRPIRAWAVALACLAGALAAQDTQSEFWPRLDAYANLGAATRLLFRTSFNNDDETKSWRGTFGLHFDIALKPVFRRELRSREDVFIKRFLSFRAGFRYITSLGASASPYLEHRWLAELTSRYPLPGSFVLSDRNRGDFRFVRGQPFSTRYRNRLQIERDFRAERVVFTPYLNAEAFYDTRYGAWSRFRYEFGTQVPVGPHFVLDTYFARQRSKQSQPPHGNALGLTLSAYF